MEIPKDKVLEKIKSQGDDSKTQQAQDELPEKVDTEKDQGLLEKFGVDPKDLMGGIGDKLGM